MKPSTLQIGAVAAVALLACGLSGCASEKAQEPIYLPASMTISSDYATYITTYSYDGHGNLISSTDSQVKMDGGTFIDASGDASEYEEGASYIHTKTYTIGEDGTPTSVKVTTIDKGDKKELAYDYAVTLNEDGLWQKLTKSENGNVTATATFEYEDGLPKSITQDYGRGQTTTEFDENGWETELCNQPGTVSNDSDGSLQSFNCYRGSYSCEYDENGCLTALYRDGELEAKIDYTVIEDPSPAVLALSNLKLDGIGFAYNYFWHWELGASLP